MRFNSTGRLFGFGLTCILSKSDQRRMNCIAAMAPMKKTVGIAKACTASHRTVKIGYDRGETRGVEDWDMALFQAQVELGLGFKALAHYWSFAFRSLEIGIWSWCTKDVISKTCGNEQESCKEN